MKTSRDLLSSVLRTVQLDQTGIRSVLDTSIRPGLRRALESQLRELDSIESEAYTVASQRGWDLREREPGARFLSDLAVRIRMTHGDCDSKIAGMMIHGNTKGMIRSYRNLHHYPLQDDRISSICQKLIDCETANIRQMQSYL